MPGCHAWVPTVCVPTTHTSSTRSVHTHHVLGLLGSHTTDSFHRSYVLVCSVHTRLVPAHGSTHGLRWIRSVYVTFCTPVLVLRLDHRSVLDTLHGSRAVGYTTFTVLDLHYIHTHFTHTVVTVAPACHLTYTVHSFTHVLHFHTLPGLHVPGLHCTATHTFHTVSLPALARTHCMHTTFAPRSLLHTLHHGSHTRLWITFCISWVRLIPLQFYWLVGCSCSFLLRFTAFSAVHYFAFSLSAVCFLSRGFYSPLLFYLHHLHVRLVPRSLRWLVWADSGSTRSPGYSSVTFWFGSFDHVHGSPRSTVLLHWVWFTTVATTLLPFHHTFATVLGYLLHVTLHAVPFSPILHGFTFTGYTHVHVHGSSRYTVHTTHTFHTWFWLFGSRLPGWILSVLPRYVHYTTFTVGFYSSSVPTLDHRSHTHTTTHTTHCTRFTFTTSHGLHTTLHLPLVAGLHHLVGSGSRMDSPVGPGLPHLSTRSHVYGPTFTWVRFWVLHFTHIHVCSGSHHIGWFTFYTTRYGWTHTGSTRFLHYRTPQFGSWVTGFRLRWLVPHVYILPTYAHVYLTFADTTWFGLVLTRSVLHVLHTDGPQFTRTTTVYTCLQFHTFTLRFSRSGVHWFWFRLTLPPTGWVHVYLDTSRSYTFPVGWLVLDSFYWILPTHTVLPHVVPAHTHTVLGLPHTTPRSTRSRFTCTPFTHHCLPTYNAPYILVCTHTVHTTFHHVLHYTTVGFYVLWTTFTFWIHTVLDHT